VVAVLHDLNLAVRFADRIVMLHHGRVATTGSPAATITSDLVRRVFEIEVAVAHTEDGMPFVLPQAMRRI
jgi:iron complex transport system ATP-binding protein